MAAGPIETELYPTLPPLASTISDYQVGIKLGHRHHAIVLISHRPLNMANFIILTILLVSGQVEARPLASSPNSANLLVLLVPILITMAVCCLVACCDCRTARGKRRSIYELDELEPRRDDVVVTCRTSADICLYGYCEPPPPYPVDTRQSNTLRQPDPALAMFHTRRNDVPRQAAAAAGDDEPDTNKAGVLQKVGHTTRLPAYNTERIDTPKSGATSMRSITEYCSTRSTASRQSNACVIAIPAAVRIRDHPANWR